MALGCALRLHGVEGCGARTHRRRVVSPRQMSLNAFTSCLEDCCIPDNESQFCKKSDCDTLFIVAKGGCAAPSNPLIAAAPRDPLAPPS